VRRVCGRQTLLTRLLLLATVLLTVASAQTASASPALPAATVYPASEWQSTIDTLIHADVVKSAVLPGGDIVWAFGDTLQAHGQDTHYGSGYPHDALVLQQPGSLDFTIASGPYGYGIQQVPDWSDGSYFWMNTPIVDGSTLYVIGERIMHNVQFQYLGEYMAEFDANTLSYEGVVRIPAGSTDRTQWGGVARGVHGWWISGAHEVPCQRYDDCFEGDIAWVPFGGLADAGDWTVNEDVVPSYLDLGSTIAIARLGPAAFDLFTKRGDAYGGDVVERLVSDSISGPWILSGTWPISSPARSETYSVAVHPEQASPSGQVLVSFGVGGIGWQGFGAGFLYLPVSPLPTEGYWLAAADGTVFPAGGATSFGGVVTPSTDPVVGVAATADGNGYWEVTRDGEVAPFGDAGNFGDLTGSGVRVADIVAVAPTSNDRGYWLIGSDGGEFAFGDARYRGSLPALGVRVQDIVGMVSSPTGSGYLLVGADGGVFSFGTGSGYFGSLPGLGVHVDDIRSILSAPAGTGYDLVGADGGVFDFGHGVPFYGSLPGRRVAVDDVVGLGQTPDGEGYWLAGADGTVYDFGDAHAFPSPPGISSHLPIAAVAAR
jgi:hypothetical protein